MYFLFDDGSLWFLSWLMLLFTSYISPLELKHLGKLSFCISYQSLSYK